MKHRMHAFSAASLLAAFSVFSTTGAFAQPTYDRAPILPVSYEVDENEFDPSETWIKFENVIRLKYAYNDRGEIDLNHQLARSRELAYAAKDLSELRSVLRATVFALLDPHLVINPYSPGDYGYKNGDLVMAFVDGLPTVLDVRRGSPAEAFGLRPNDIIREVDGEPAEIAALRPFGQVLPNATPRHRDYGLTLAANGQAGRKRHFVVARNDADRLVELPSVGEYAESLADRDPVMLDFVAEDSSIAHIVIQDALGDNDLIEAFDRIMADAANARAIILDLRETPSGGNTEVARSIIGHFISETRPYQMHRVPVLEREFGVPRQFVEYVTPRLPHYAGQIVVLHGRWTGSMGEGLVIGMDAATNAVTIGSDMANLLGAIWTEELDDDGTTFHYAGESLFHVNGTPREDFVADIMVDPAGVAPDGRDQALERAIELLSGLDLQTIERTKGIE